MKLFFLFDRQHLALRRISSMDHQTCLRMACRCSVNVLSGEISRWADTAGDRDMFTLDHNYQILCLVLE